MYVCVSCGYETLGWSGKCPQCGAWGSLQEQKTAGGSVSRIPGQTREVTVASLSAISSLSAKPFSRRVSLRIDELDRCLGGGVVRGEVVLLAGEPGIGKSTLLLQVALSLDEKVIYVSGEESLTQLYSRIERLSNHSGCADTGVRVGAEVQAKTQAEAQAGMAIESREYGKATRREDRRNVQTPVKHLLLTDETDVDSVIAAVSKNKPEFVVVDSIQSLSTKDIPGYPGSISQVRECGARLTQCAKKLDIPIIIVGQVTKEGAIAGPKVLEHVVDAVLSFEGDDSGLFRLVRCLKNRFGTTDEVGVFEMTSAGLKEVKDPSRVFTSVSREMPGTALSAVYRGSRVLFVEVQALTSPAVFGTARRVGNGVSKQRVEMLCAVLSRRGGVDVSGDDVYVSVIGGIQIDDPSIDTAVCMAIASAKKDRALNMSAVWVGEVGLTGEIRKPAVWEKIVKAVKNNELLTTDFTKHSPLYLKEAIKGAAVPKSSKS